MKALEKDRTRRYETANGLAMDVQRFLRNEPVEARPPSSLYRFQKLVRRNQRRLRRRRRGVGRAGSRAGPFALSVCPGAARVARRKRGREARRSRRSGARPSCANRRRKGWPSEKQMREMVPVTDKFTTAGRLLSQGKMEEAEKVISDIPPNIRQGSILYNALAEVYGRKGDYPSAIRNFNRSIIADPTNHYAWHYLAPLLVETGDLPGYREHCERALRQFGETSDPLVAERIAKDCLILPPPASRLPAMAKMADTAITAGPNDNAWPYYAFVKGLAEYRQGHFPAASEWLNKAAPNEGVPTRTAQVYATLAMANTRRSQRSRARIIGRRP